MMRNLSAAIVAGLVLAAAPSAFADTFKSAEHRFSAIFPGAVEQGPPKDNATDENDKVISRMTEFTNSAPGRYVAMVIADAYITPYPIQSTTYIPHNIKGFLDGIKGTATQKDILFEGNPAVQFAFDTPDHSIQGQGLLVFVPGAMPRAYMVAALPGPDATAEDRAKLNAFITSFDID
jgi:hypothetical protein